MILLTTGFLFMFIPARSGLSQSNSIKRLIQLTVIQLSGGHFNNTLDTSVKAGATAPLLRITEQSARNYYCLQTLTKIMQVIVKMSYQFMITTFAIK